jgi:hypothetical protein
MHDRRHSSGPLLGRRNFQVFVAGIFDSGHLRTHLCRAPLYPSRSPSEIPVAHCGPLFAMTLAPLQNPCRETRARQHYRRRHDLTSMNEQTPRLPVCVRTTEICDPQPLACSDMGLHLHQRLPKSSMLPSNPLSPKPHRSLGATWKKRLARSFGGGTDAQSSLDRDEGRRRHADGWLRIPAGRAP